MNILYLTNHLNVGGITNYILTLTKGMKEKGHCIYLASSGGELLYKFLENKITYIPISIKTKQDISPKILASMFKLLKVVKENYIDIVHSHSRTTQILGCLLSRRTGIKHVSTCHGFFKTRIFRKMFPCWGSKVIAISDAVKEHLMQDFNLDEHNIRVIHNGVDIAKSKLQNLECRIEIKNKLGLGDGPLVGIVARLSDVKGHSFLIQAMKIVLEKIPSAQLLIVGEGKEKEKLIALTQRLGIEKSVFFIPVVTDTQRMLSLMDLFVMPSLKEGLGLALMEAMGMGLPVIGSDVGGIKNLIKDGYNGLLVKPKDTQALALTILELLQDSKMRQVLGNQAHIFIKENFSSEKMISQTEKVYKECLNIND